MGAIIGAMYALGKTTSEMEEILKNLTKIKYLTLLDRPGRD
jgi:predicted acylesterase/phospholipase RssA